VPPRSLYFDLGAYLRAQAKRTVPYTPAIPAIYGLDAALDELLDEGLANRQAYYQARADYLDREFSRLGLEPRVPREHRSRSVRSLPLPPGITYDALHDAAKKEGYIIYGGLGEAAKTSFRVCALGALKIEALQGFVAVLERALAERTTLLARQRALITETIRGLRIDDTPEATAQAICRQVINVTGVMAARISLFELDGSASPIGFAVVGKADPILRKPSSLRSRQLHDRSVDGPWIEPWTRRRGHPDNQLLAGLGVHSVVYAPVRDNRQLIGLLCVDAEGSAGATDVAELLPAVTEFADLAGALIGRDVNQRAEVGRGRDRISEIIAQRAFHPVFQPIADIGRHRIVGYEALTRFDSGSNPEVVFAEADTVGLGHELEAATLEAALEASAALPRRAWLNLNASPGLVIAGEPLKSILSGSKRRLVLEVTEHTAIENYPVFLEAMAALGPKVRLAVDDAGAGFASLRHILELRPAYVKLDRWLVAGLDSDDARQAMIVGLRHFAGATGCRLIAEGIETEGELAVLRALDIPLGQGYLLGRPVPIAAWVHEEQATEAL